MKPATIFVLLLSIPCTAQASGYFAFDAGARGVYQAVLDLRFGEAEAALLSMQQQSPENLVIPLLENYLEVLQILAADDEAAYRRLSAGMDKRLWKISRGDPQSPWFRYTQAEIRLQWAALKVRFGDYLSAASDVKQGYELLRDNQNRFPDFKPNLKGLGLVHVVAGNIPDEYQWAVRVLTGIRGSVEQGMSELESLLKYAESNDYPFENELIIIYSALQLHINGREDLALKAMLRPTVVPGSSALFAYARAQAYLRSGRTDEAISVLQGSPRGGRYHPFPYTDYLYGTAQVYRLDLAEAERSLTRFVQSFGGKTALKTAWQKLAWISLLNGDQQGYYQRMWMVKQTGTARSDADKAAAREADSGEIPDVRLLRARILFDGGYYEKAYQFLKNRAAEFTYQPRVQLEYTYRMGRIAHKLGKTAEARQYYEQTINSGEQQPWYFACNAALQTGYLLEEKKDMENARLYYRKCLNMKPKEYASGLHAKAKARLNRLS
jgi:tetratricopeptide (TPR) repeat protein